MEEKDRKNKERRARLATYASIAATLIALLSAVIVALIGYENNQVTVRANEAEQAATIAVQTQELIDKQKQRRETFIQNITPRLIDPNPSVRLAVAILEPDDRLFQTIGSLSGYQQCNSFALKAAQEEQGGWAIVFAHSDTAVGAEAEVDRANEK